MFKNKKAVIFDFDDTIVDFEYHTLSKWENTCLRLNDDIDPQFKDTFNYILKLNGIGYTNHIKDTCTILNLDNIELINKIYERYLETPANDILYDGVIKILKSLKKRDYKLGILTNGKSKTHRRRIEVLGLMDYIDYVQYGDEILKPFKKPFLDIIEKLEVSPQETIFIGNNPEIDSITPKELGMTTVLFDPYGKYKSIGHFYNILGFLDYIIKDYRELTSILINGE